MGFRQVLELRRNLTDITGMVDGTMTVCDDRNRQAHHRKLFVILFPVDGVDIALKPVVAIIKIRNHQIKSPDHRLANGTDVVRVAHEDKVVAAHMSDKPFSFRKFPDDGGENAAGDNEYFVAPAVSVAVVKRFEIIDVEIGQRKGLAAFNAGRGFKEDAGIAGKTGERVGIKGAGEPAQTEAHPVDDFVWAIGNADIVVHVDRSPVDIIETDVANHDNQRQSAEERIVLDVFGERLY